MNKIIIQKIAIFGKKIITHKNYIKQKEYMQHQKTSVYTHCLNAAYNSLLIARFFHLKIDEESLIRASLLHDYFLYDWHIKDKSHKWHGFIHAKRALKNADTDFHLNEVEKDAILKHMFPLNIVPPKYLISHIVNIGDTISTIKEIIFKKRIKKIINEIEKKCFE